MNHLTTEQQALLMLLRQSLWGERAALPEGVDWPRLDAAAREQGIVSFAFDGAVAAGLDLPGEVRRKWKTQTLAGVTKSERLLQAQDDLTLRFAGAGIPMVVLKGSSVARYYPKPDLRQLGDIDILVRPEDVARAKGLIEACGYTEQEADHDFHIEYARPGAYLELHYNVTSLPNTPGGRAAQAVIDKFLDGTEQGRVGDHTFPVLSAPHQALSLLLHMIRHMFHEGIGLRQLCDWMVYVGATEEAVFAETVAPVLEGCGLLEYAKAATRTCVDYLGLPGAAPAWCESVREETSRAFLEAVFRGGSMGQADQESMGSLFTDKDAMGDPRSSSFRALISGLNKLTYQHFPFVEKCKLLLPIFWVYLPARYLVRSMLGLRPKKSVLKVTSLARQKRSLYEDLKLFEL